MTTMKWLMVIPKSCWTVLTNRAGPLLKAELIRVVPRPAMGTRKSRGMERMAMLSVAGTTRSSMMVSERSPVTVVSLPKMALAPLPRLRVSLPTARIVMGWPGGGCLASPGTTMRFTCPSRH